MKFSTRQRMFVQLSLLSLFFAVCYLVQYPQTYFNPADRDLGDGGIEDGINVLGSWQKCRGGSPGVKTQQWRATMQEVLNEIPTVATVNSSIVMIVGIPSAGDTLIDSYKTAFYSLGFLIEFLKANDGASENSLTPNWMPQNRTVFCLDRQNCLDRSFYPTGLLKINHIDGLNSALDELNTKTICQQGQQLWCLSENNESQIRSEFISNHSFWIVSQQTVPTFVKVPAASLEYFLKKVQQNTLLSGKLIRTEPFLVLDRPVRISAYILVRGSDPMIFYLHKDGLVRIANFMTFGASEHETELVWNFAQFQKYLLITHRELPVANFFHDVRDVVTDLLKEVTRSRRPDGQPAGLECSNCYQVLEATLLLNKFLVPYVVSVTEHLRFVDSLSPVPNKIMQSIVQFMLDPGARDASSEDILDAFLSADFYDVIKENCKDAADDKSCLSRRTLQNVLTSAVVLMKAPKYGFDFITSYSPSSNGLAELMEKTVKCFPVIDEILATAEVENFQEHSTKSWSGRQCQYESMFRSLMLHVDFAPHFATVPDFHPLTTAYDIFVPFNTTVAEMEFFPADCATEVIIAGDLEPVLPNHGSLTIGVGENLIQAHVIKRNPLTSSVPTVLKSYSFRINRQSREEAGVTVTGNDSHEICYLRQSCDLKLYPAESCDLQAETYFNISAFSSGYFSDFELESSKNPARWIVPCKNCRDDSSCDWMQARWSPEISRHQVLDDDQVKKCLENKKLVFVGDSTNRGIMAYILQLFNGTLWEDEKIHSVKSYDLNGGNTSFSFAYYPQFWLPQNQRPSFKKAVYQGIKASEPVSNNTETVFVVGGLQFMRSSQLIELQTALATKGLQGSRVVIKSLGSGFFIPSRGVHRINAENLHALVDQNLQLVMKSRQLGFRTVDTFEMTVARYNEFRAGKCSCHFHSIEEQLTNSRILPDHVKQKTFNVQGPINALYSRMVLREICL